jgi:hypothetical protein
MFRDLKLGGYNLEVTQVGDRRLKIKLFKI